MKKIILMAAAAIITLSAAAQNVKMAYVNYSELVQLMPESDQARAALNASQKEAEETYQSMTEEFNSKYQQYTQKSSTWTATIRESKEKELTDIQSRIQEFQQNIQVELQQQQQTLMAPIQKKAMDAVTKLAKDRGFALVFDASQYVYVDPAQLTDLTPDARKALNIPEGRTLETLQAELQAQAAQAQ